MKESNRLDQKGLSAILDMSVPLEVTGMPATRPQSPQLQNQFHVCHGAAHMEHMGDIPMHIFVGLGSLLPCLPPSLAASSLHAYKTNIE